MDTSSDTDWSGPERGHYSSRTQINAGGPKRGHYSSHLLVESNLFYWGHYQVISRAIIELRRGALSQTLSPPGNHKYETWTDPYFIWHKIGVARRRAIVQVRLK